MTRLLALILAAALAPACGGKPLVLVAQTGQTLAGAIGDAARANTQLQQTGVLTAEQARTVAVSLRTANQRMEPLPNLLVAIDNATKAGQTDAARIDAALAILRDVGLDLDDVVKGLPAGNVAAQVLQAVTEARRLQAQIVDLLARRKAGVARTLLAPALAN